MKYNSFEILIVGVGNLGLRYLEGILNSDLKCNISLLDINIDNLNKVKSFVKKKKFENNIFYLNDIKDLKGSFDVGIISTYSSKRNLLIEEINFKVTIKNWIIEKILAQSSSECNHILQTLLHQKAWVNLPRRYMSYYKVLQKFLKKTKNIEINVDGGNWGLACNAIHFLDLIEYLTSQKIAIVNCSNLYKEWFKSKRDGFYEINGIISGQTNQGTLFKLKSTNDKNERLISIISKEFEIIINEMKEEVIFNNRKKKKVTIIYQSQITENILKDILIFSKSDLPTLQNSVILHRLFLDEIKSHWNYSNNLNDLKVPIT